MRGSVRPMHSRTAMVRSTGERSPFRMRGAASAIVRAVSASSPSLTSVPPSPNAGHPGPVRSHRDRSGSALPRGRAIRPVPPVPPVIGPHRYRVLLPIPWRARPRATVADEEPSQSWPMTEVEERGAPPIDRYQRSSHERRVIGGEKGDGGGDLLYRGLATERLQRRGILASSEVRCRGVRRHASPSLVHVVVDVAWGDRVDPDAAWAEIDGQLFGQRNDAPFGGRVGRCIWRTDHTECRGDVDNGSARRSDQTRDRVLDAEEDPAQVDGNHPIPHVVVQLVDRRKCARDTGVVHQHVDPAMRLDDGIDHRLHIGRPRDVTRDEAAVGRQLAKITLRCLTKTCVDVGDNHGCAFGGQPNGDGPADTGGTPGDDGDLARKPPAILAHRSSSRSTAGYLRPVAADPWLTRFVT